MRTRMLVERVSDLIGTKCGPWSLVGVEVVLVVGAEQSQVVAVALTQINSKCNGTNGKST